MARSRSTLKGGRGNNVDASLLVRRLRKVGDAMGNHEPTSAIHTARQKDWARRGVRRTTAVLLVLAAGCTSGQYDRALAKCRAQWGDYDALSVQVCIEQRIAHKADRGIGDLNWTEALRVWRDTSLLNDGFNVRGVQRPAPHPLTPPGRLYYFDDGRWVLR